MTKHAENDAVESPSEPYFQLKRAINAAWRQIMGRTDEPVIEINGGGVLMRTEPLDSLLFTGDENMCWTYSGPPPHAVQKPRRVRRLSWREAEKQAGRPPSSIIDRPNGEREFTFNQREAAKEAPPVEEPPRVALFERAVPKRKVVL